MKKIKKVVSVLKGVVRLIKDPFTIQRLQAENEEIFSDSINDFNTKNRLFYELDKRSRANEILLKDNQELVMQNVNAAECNLEFEIANRKLTETMRTIVKFITLPQKKDLYELLWKAGYDNNHVFLYTSVSSILGKEVHELFPEELEAGYFDHDNIVGVEYLEIVEFGTNYYADLGRLDDRIRYEELVDITDDGYITYETKKYEVALDNIIQSLCE